LGGNLGGNSVNKSAAAGSRTIEVARVRITEAGRRTITEGC
jgi:hypothetical protein